MPNELQDALQAAFDETEKTDSESDTETSEKSKEGDKAENVDKTNEDEEGEAADEDEPEESTEDSKRTSAALNLYSLLTNPETAEEALNKIAKNAGYELKNLNKKQRSAVLDQIEESLQETLGDQAALLPNNFSEALERIITAHTNSLKAKVESLESRLNQDAQKQHERSVDDAMRWAAKEYSDFNDPIMMKRMAKEMQALQPAPGSDVKAYLTKMYLLAGGKPKASSTERNARTKQNLDGRKPSDDVRKARSTQPVNSLTDAINQAYKELYPDEE